MGYNYSIEIYSGRVFCGSGLFYTIDECIDFLKSDGFSNKGIIYNLKTGEKITVKIKPTLE